MGRIKNNFCVFIIILIIQGCRGNAICINTVQKTIVSKSGNIISFSIEDSTDTYTFRLKDNVKSQKVVDLTDITRNNNLLENYPGARIKSFYLQPNMKYVFRNYTDGDAGIETVNFNTDSLGYLHNLDIGVCE
jgi:hypothetical protein